MKKALINYWVDLATGIAFILCAVTGIVFLFPGAVHTAIGAAPTILLIPATWWHTVHDWTGVVMVAGTALHLALHAKWITHMTRKVFGEQAQPGRARAGQRGRTTRPALVPGAATQEATGASAVASPASAASTLDRRTTAEADAAAAASLERLNALRAERLLEREQRISRRRFLGSAAAVGAGVLLAGVGILGRDAVSGASTRSDGSAAGGQGQSPTSASDVGGTGSAAGSGGGVDSTTSGSSAQSGTSGGSSSAQIVLVNQSACVACGRCLQVCPRSVFDWSSSGRADAVNAGACIRCGRCLQVCPAGAITVNA